MSRLTDFETKSKRTLRWDENLGQCSLSSMPVWQSKVGLRQWKSCLYLWLRRSLNLTLKSSKKLNSLNIVIIKCRPFRWSNLAKKYFSNWEIL